MGSVLFSFTLFVSLSLLAGNPLPKNYNTQPIELQPLGPIKTVKLKASFKIPDGYKSKVRGFMDVFEKTENGWQKIQTIGEQDQPLFRVDNTMRFLEEIRLNKSDSEVAINMSVAFCDKACFINNFQGTTGRDKKSKQNFLSFNKQGFLPHQ